MPNLCPCRRCRDPRIPFKRAMKLCIDAAAIARYGEEEFRTRKEAERERLEKLHQEKCDET